MLYLLKCQTSSEELHKKENHIHVPCKTKYKIRYGAACLMPGEDVSRRNTLEALADEIADGAWAPNPKVLAIQNFICSS